MKPQKKRTVEIIFAYTSEKACPAPWAGTTDANCFSCEYFNGVLRRQYGFYVECSWPIERKEDEQ